MFALRKDAYLGARITRKKMKRDALRGALKALEEPIKEIEEYECSEWDELCQQVLGRTDVVLLTPISKSLSDLKGSGRNKFAYTRNS